MKSKLGLVLLVVIALSVAGYLWYAGKPGVPESLEGIATTTDEVVTAPPPIGSIRTGVVGTWRSDEDAKFTREFKNNGTVTDRYAGDSDATVTGSWNVVTDTSSLPSALQEVDDTILRVAFLEEVLYFIVAKVDEDELVMHYAGTNSTLSFSRVD